MKYDALIIPFKWKTKTKNLEKLGFPTKTPSFPRKTTKGTLVVKRPFLTPRIFTVGEKGPTLVEKREK